MIIKDAWNTVKDKWEEIFGDDAERSNMKQLIGAIEVGEAMGYDTCRSLFECSEDFFQVQQARITCDGAGNANFECIIRRFTKSAESSRKYPFSFLIKLKKV